MEGSGLELELLCDGLRWTVGNGRVAAFWKDMRPGDKALCNFTISQVEGEELDSKIEDYWDCNCGWKWELLSHRMSFTHLTMLASVLFL